MTNLEKEENLAIGGYLMEEEKLSLMEEGARVRIAKLLQDVNSPTTWSEFNKLTSLLSAQRHAVNKLYRELAEQYPDFVNRVGGKYEHI